MRRPFQGVLNIIRFNWHFYLFSAASAIILFLVSTTDIPEPLTSFVKVLFWMVIGLNVISLAVSWYIYDVSELYSLRWLDGLGWKENQTLVNINAGFDETSVLLQKRFPESEFTALDFYDPKKHTEVSIRRARNAYPPISGTIKISTDSLACANNSIDVIFCILSAHEIRNQEEREVFFNELARILKPSGQIIVTEHLRDIPNLLVYTIGFFHFHSRKTWLKTFSAANIGVHKEIKITPFISAFILEKYGATS